MRRRRSLWSQGYKEHHPTRSVSERNGSGAHVWPSVSICSLASPKGTRLGHPPLHSGRDLRSHHLRAAALRVVKKTNPVHVVAQIGVGARDKPTPTSRYRPDTRSGPTILRLLLPCSQCLPWAKPKPVHVASPQERGINPRPHPNPGLTQGQALRFGDSAIPRTRDHPEPTGCR